MTASRILPRATLLLAAAAAVSGLMAPIARTQAQSQITSPEKFFGFRMGADRRIARWDKMIEYYQLLEKESDGRLRALNMGPTTEGNPFLLVVVTSSANMAKLERLREVNLRLSDPRGVAEAEIQKLVAEGKAFVCQSMSMHATEIGGTQMAPELAWDLLARQDEETRRILDNVVFLMVPSFNPDGQLMVTDWYNKYLNTEYEGTSPPWLYQKYAGHDNNRDAFMTNLAESRHMAKILFTDWKPQAYVDHHHMGSNGARIYLPPYADPVRPLADPLVWRELSWYGAHMAYKEEESGLSGVLNHAVYSGWGHFGFHWITPFHNIAGMLTESAGTRLATPLFIHPDQLRGGTRGLPAYEEQTTFPNPWPGGWWRLRDIVDRQKVASWSTLDLAARNKETVLWNTYLKARRQTERGAAGKPAAYVIPAAQHDPLTALKLVNKLLAQGIEVQRASRSFTTEAGMVCSAGSFLVSLAQPKMGLIRYLLGRTFYPDNEWTRNRDGTPMSPYDMATDTMFEFMGVRVEPVDEAPAGGLEKLTGPPLPAGKVAQGAAGSVLDSRLNDSFRAVNLLLDKGVTVRRVDKAGDGLRAGDFLAARGPEAVLAEVAKATGVDFSPLNAQPKQAVHEVKRLRTGVYQRYRGGNADEGWTRLMLEQFQFPYKTLMDAEIKKGGLNNNFDVIILPNDSTATLVGETAGAAAMGGAGRRAAGGRRGGAAEAAPAAAQPAAGTPPAAPAGGRGGNPPPEYRSGLGADGVAALKEFVQKGGSIVTLNSAATFAIERLGVSVRNVTAGRSSREYWCPGSTLRVSVDNGNPLGYGMPAQTLAVVLRSTPAFEITATEDADKYETVVRYADRNLLQSGWLIGEEILAKRAVVVSAKVGEGKVVLIGFPAQYRDQTHGTFKLVFNTLLR